MALAYALVESRTPPWFCMPKHADAPRSLSSQGLARLLGSLHVDPDEAAREYERLRGRLVRFFDWRGVHTPDECADEAFDRLARRLEDASIDDVPRYLFGIARLVALESRRSPQPAALDDAPAKVLMMAPALPETESPLQGCFDRCLDQLPGTDRTLLLRYYEGERHAKISNRRQLATTLGLTDNALRSRMQRLRDGLERCVHGCTSTGEARAS